jgi:hypothetical protein
MIFFVANGEPDSCGPGCSEWIAAEGRFEGPQVERRFRDLLDTLKGRNLPIVFNSLGGVIGEALVLGRILRERRMAASVGESYPVGCTARIAADESCRRIMEANRELKARLRTTGTECYSACVYALLGASARHVPSDARVGIHASAPTAVSSRPGAPTDEQLHKTESATSWRWAPIPVSKMRQLRRRRQARTSLVGRSLSDTESRRVRPTNPIGCSIKNRKDPAIVHAEGGYPAQGRRCHGIPNH